MTTAIARIVSAAIGSLSDHETCEDPDGLGLVAKPSSTVDDSAILALHRIFQHTFLEALDLIDREKGEWLLSCWLPSFVCFD